MGLWSVLECVGEAKTSFKIKLDNHPFNTLNKNYIPTCHDFTQNEHFIKHAKFTLIETIMNMNKPKEVLLNIFEKCKELLIKTWENIH